MSVELFGKISGNYNDAAKNLPNYPQLSAKLSNLFGIGGVLAAI